MYDEIRKPKLLKDVPLTLIRPLPTIYYANKFAIQEVPKNIKQLYDSNIEFLEQALKIISTVLKNVKFNKLADQALGLKTTPSPAHLDKIQEFNINLAELCSATKADIRKQINEIKMQLTKAYPSLVNTIHVLVIDNSLGKQNIEKVKSALKNFCHYKVDDTQPNSSDILTKMINTDFVLFYSTFSPEIHQQVKSLETYHIPGLAVVQFEKDEILDKEAIRHGSQLMKIGFPVLFKMFTPIRLFTTIDKTHLSYHLH
jgi:hypothetical protein